MNSSVVERFRRQLGLSRAALARLVGIHPATYGKLESGDRSAVAADGGWAPAAQAVAAWHGVSPDMLWPHRDRVRPPTSDLPPTPLDVLEARERQYLVYEAMRRLSPREIIMLAYRCGLDGNGPREYQVIGGIFGVSRERARQIVIRSIARVRRVASFLRVPDLSTWRPPTFELSPTRCVVTWHAETPRAPTRVPAVVAACSWLNSPYSAAFRAALEAS